MNPTTLMIFAIRACLPGALPVEDAVCVHGASAYSRALCDTLHLALLDPGFRVRPSPRNGGSIQFAGGCLPCYR